MIIFHAVPWLALCAATLACLGIAHRAETRTAKLRATWPGLRDDELHATPQDRSRT